MDTSGILLIAKNAHAQADFMKKDAVYIVSGIIDTRAEEVKNGISPWFDIIEEKLDGGWACFAAKLK